MPDIQWNCPFCGSYQTITNPKADTSVAPISVGENIHKIFGFRVESIGCSNPDCLKVQIDFSLERWGEHGHRIPNSVFFKKRVIPDSVAKPQPDYISAPLREDYTEACLIIDASPKASATLARRCLQGMIRDFCGISKPTLNQEIQGLRKLVEEDKAPRGVSPESVDAIDHVRTIGNIGAHMEKDINHIVPVDQGEARILIELVETLFREWYIERHEREERFNKLRGIAHEKTALKDSHKSETSSSQDVNQE